MPKIVVQSTEEGVVLPAKTLEQAGVEPGSVIELNVELLPTQREIHLRALRHTAWKLGDAIRVAQPLWTAGEWRVDLLSHDGAEQIGALYYDAHGELIADRSSTLATLG